MFQNKGSNKIYNKTFFLKINTQFLILLILIIIIIQLYNNSKFSIKSNSDEYKQYYFTYFGIFYIINLTYINYSFSFKYKIAKVEYIFGFYNENNDLINPSDLTLYKNLHIICNYIENNKNNITIYSLANIYNNQFFRCIKFFKLYQKEIFGINVLKKYKKYYFNKYFFFFDSNKIKYNNINNNNKEFNPLIINRLYMSLIHKIKNNKNETNSLNLKKSYIQYPIVFSKNNINITINNWTFINIYNNYFCICRGKKCSYVKINQKCKYYFYLNIIDINKNVYNKTHYLFSDFIVAYRSSDDTYPIFKEMIKLNFSSHYLTEKKTIYKEYCQNLKRCLSIILVNKKTHIINGNFLEAYLTLFLKLKSVITGAHFFFINNLFYNIGYITYISVGHGVAIFKQFLYSGNNYYGYKKFNKILLPPSEKIISVAKQKGWNDNNIIKINLPRWDKYVNIEDNLYFIEHKNIIKRNSIFIMFTWRKCLAKKKISLYYIKNIFNLLYSNKLKKELKKNNILLYFSLHHKIKYLKDKFKLNQYIIYIKENEISNCLSKTSLIVSDFSSIIFDIICRNKPYIIFIPDANDPQLKYIYNRNINEIIKSFKNNIFQFENIYFELNETINKIIYYIKNNFTLDTKLKKLYTTFSFKSGNNIKKFISYLKNLK